MVRNVADAKLKLEKPGADVEKLQADITKMEADVKEWDAKIAAMQKEVEDRRANPPPQPDWAMGVRALAEPTDCRVHIRGETTNLGPSVPRGVLQAISLEPSEAARAEPTGRLRLADWLADDSNPLTPRVAVNRVWMHLLGQGLVTTVDDFGINGSPPSHPELLEHLATREFVDDGWSIKGLVRRIVSSRTYQLASQEVASQGTASQETKPDSDAGSPYAQGLAVDPGNVYLWRFRPRRLTAEMFRDSVMSVSGRLDASIPQAQLLDQWNRYEEDQVKSSKPFITADAVEHDRRSVYLPVLREVLPEVFELFDFADPNRSVGQREVSTVPAQALFLMNSPWVIERATWTAERILSEASNDAARVDRLFMLALGRLPTDQERRDSLAYLEETEELLGSEAKAPSDEQQALEPLEQLLSTYLASGEFRYIQ